MQRPAGLTGLAKAASDVGPSAYQWALILALFLVGYRRLALTLAVSCLLALWFRELLALALHSPRPYFLDPSLLRAGVPPGPRYGYGLPSGHAFWGTAFWFILAAQVKQRWAWIAAGIVSFLIGVSRLYLGVHFPSDVGLGIVLGLGWAWATCRAGPWVETWCSCRSRLELAAWTVGLAAVLAITASLIQSAYSELSAPDLWIAGFGVRERMAEVGHRSAGALAGLGLGVLAAIPLSTGKQGGQAPSPDAGETSSGALPAGGVPVWRCLVGIGVLALIAKFGVQPAGDAVVLRRPELTALVAAVQFFLLWGAGPAALVRLRLARRNAVA